ncbi:MAG: hypothetical protein ACLQPD_13025 [Desulfomonilaceae bacterium]
MKRPTVIAVVILVTIGILMHFYLGDRFSACAHQQLVATDTKNLATESKAEDFPKGTGTPSVECGECHQAMYREYAYGFGADVIYNSEKEGLLSLTGRVLTAGPAHSVSGIISEPPHGSVKGEFALCSACHYPEPFDLPDLNKPVAEQSKQEPLAKKALGITCASCHLTPDGKIRGPYGAAAPHTTVKEPSMKTADMCAHCHSASKRVVGKQLQTFLEWRDDFNKPGLGSEQCQDCHMARTLRKSAEDEDVPIRAVARHLWTGGHSPQGISTALSIAIVTEKKSTSALRLHLTNIGAGHSVPTGSRRRAIYLKADVVDDKGAVVAKRDWMFAPWHGDRPDDKAFLEEDKKRGDVALAASDEQGPHETIIRAGEERVLTWDPELGPGEYKVRTSLIYDTNRYTDPKVEGHQMTIFSRTLSLTVK